MPVYLVTAIEPKGGTRQFKHIADVPLRRGDSIYDRLREDTPLDAYRVERVSPDPGGKYDGLVDANWQMGVDLGATQ